MACAFQSELVRFRQRSASPEDDAFLMRLYMATRPAETEAWDMNATQRELLLRLQFKGRKMMYATKFPDAEDWIICIEGGAHHGTAVGRHLLARREDAIYGIDLAILPAYQGHGIGRRVLQAVQRSCVADGRCFKLQVLQTNRAQRLYARLGFKVVSHNPVYVQMAWSASEAQGERTG